jgi:hypothetical protein
LSCEALEPRLALAAFNLVHTFEGPNATDFGHTVALSATSVLIGSQDGAFLYSTSGQLLKTFKDPNHSSSDYFGFTVGLSGKNVLIGAVGSSGDAGAAYLFNTSGKLLHTFTNPDPANEYAFGDSLAVSGSNVLIGAQLKGGGVADYLYDTSGRLLHTFRFVNHTNAYLAELVALSGNKLLLGVPGANQGVGAAYLYDTSGKLLQSFEGPTTADAQGFGDSVSLSGTDVLIGAEGPAGGNGATYWYNYSGKLLRTIPAGGSVVVSGSYVLVAENQGYHGYEAAFVGNTAYLYNTSGQQLETFTDPVGPGDAGFGDWIALAGSHLVIGTAGIDNNGNLLDEVYLYSASSSKPPRLPSAPEKLVSDTGSRWQ